VCVGGGGGVRGARLTKQAGIQCQRHPHSAGTTATSHMPHPLARPQENKRRRIKAGKQATKPRKQHGLHTCRNVSVPVSPCGVSMSGGTNVVKAHDLISLPEGNLTSRRFQQPCVCRGGGREGGAKSVGCWQRALGLQHGLALHTQSADSC
jgi:hypothetical protein